MSERSEGFEDYNDELLRNDYSELEQSIQR